SVMACRSGSNVAPPVVRGAASAEAKPAVKGGIPTVRVLLDDPRLAAARGFDHAKDWPAAAKAVREARPVDLAGPEACRWDYLEARLLVLAGEPVEAIPAYERAARPECPLAGYATLRAAQALARSGRADEALAKARAVPEDL